MIGLLRSKLYLEYGKINITFPDGFKTLLNSFNAFIGFATCSNWCEESKKSYLSLFIFVRFVEQFINCFPIFLEGEPQM